MSLLDRFLRAGEGKKLRALQSLVPDIGALEPEMQALSDDALKAKTAEFRQRLDNGETLDDLLIEAFAVVREASRRVLGQRHFDVQLMGGAALHFGWVAEMKTGEGKTLVSTLPAYLNALTGRGVHMVTVNDYLATRDREWMGRIYHFLGLTTGLVVPGRKRPGRQAGPVRRGHHLRHQQRVRLRLRATTWRPAGAGRCSGATSTPSSTRSTRSSSTRPHAAHHLRQGRRRRSSTTVRLDRPQPERDVDYEVDRGEADRRPDGGGHREGRAHARHRQPTTGSPRTSSTSCRRRSRPRSCSGATATTSCRTAR